jgi:hypothetical protein
MRRPSGFGPPHSSEMARLGPMQHLVTAQYMGRTIDLGSDILELADWKWEARLSFFSQVQSLWPGRAASVLVKSPMHPPAW